MVIPDQNRVEIEYRDFRAGDVKHSQADISKAKTLLAYEPSHVVDQGLNDSMDWYISFFSSLLNRSS